MNENNYCIIMAGGIGSRFWPMSKTNLPKQFIDILGTGETLIQQTYNRFKKICPAQNIYIVTNKRYKQLTQTQLEGIADEQIICEPTMRNTAPCIAYANYKIANKNPDANIIVAPSDHLILKEEAFIEVVNLALAHTAANDDLVTLGITPTRPDTGYGYIQFGANDNSEIKPVKTFTEKPSLAKAKEFIESGDFCWNSGMFIWRLKTIQQAFETHLPQMDAIFKAGINTYNTAKENEFINEAFPTCENISIDYGIMEKSNNVHVLSADIGWSDLGTWGSIYTHLPLDENQNAVVGDQVMLYDATNNIINVPKEKLVVLQGLDNYIVVESDNVLLVCQKAEEQKIKQFVHDVKATQDERYY